MNINIDNLKSFNQQSFSNKFKLKHDPRNNYIFSVNETEYTYYDPIVFKNKYQFLQMIDKINQINHNVSTNMDNIKFYENDFFFNDTSISDRVKEEIRSEVADLTKLYTGTYNGTRSLVKLFEKNNEIRYSDDILSKLAESSTKIHMINEDSSINLKNIELLTKYRNDGLPECKKIYPHDKFYDEAMKQTDILWGKEMSGNKSRLKELTDSDYKKYINDQLITFDLLNDHLDPDTKKRKRNDFIEKIKGEIFQKGESLLETIDSESKQYVFGHSADLAKYRDNPEHFICMPMKMPHIGLKPCHELVEWSSFMNLYYDLVAYYNDKQNFVRFVMPEGKFFPKRKETTKTDNDVFNNYPVGMFVIDFEDDRSKDKKHPSGSLYYFIFYNISTNFSDYTYTYDWPGHAYTPTRIKLYDIYKRPVMRKLLFYGNTVTYTELNSFITYFKPYVYRSRLFKNIIFLSKKQIDLTKQSNLESVDYLTIKGASGKNYVCIRTKNKTEIDTIYKNELIYYSSSENIYYIASSKISNSSMKALKLEEYKKSYQTGGFNISSIKVNFKNTFNKYYSGADLDIAGNYFKQYAELTFKAWQRTKPNYNKFNKLAFMYYPYIYIDPFIMPIGMIDEIYKNTYDRTFRKFIVNLPVKENDVQKTYNITEYIPRTNKFFVLYEIFYNFPIIKNNTNMLLLTMDDLSFIEAGQYYATKNNLDIKKSILLIDSDKCKKLKKPDIEYMKQFNDFRDIVIVEDDLIKTKSDAKYDLIVEFTRCRFKHVEWFYEYSKFYHNIASIIYALQHLNKHGNFVFYIQNIITKMQADMVIILKQLFKNVELYQIECDADFKQISVYCICLDLINDPNDIIKKLIDILSDINGTIDQFSIEYTEDDKNIFMISDMPNKNSQYIYSILDIATTDPIYDFIKEFNESIYIKKYIYVKEIYNLLFLDDDAVNKKVAEKLQLSYYSSVIYAKKYDFRLRMYQQNLIDTKFGMEILKDMFFKHRPINYEFINLKSVDDKMIDVPNHFKRMNGLINTTHMIIDTRNIDEWFSHKTKFRYYRPSNKKLDLLNMLNDKFNVGRISQAWVKMYELLSQFELLPLNKPVIKTFHMCEAPGNFIAAINHFIKTKTKANFDWIAQSLNAEKMGVGFGDDYGYIKKYPKRWNFGKDNTGDITHIENMEYYKQITKDVDLMTSDCGISYSEESDVGSSMLKIHFAEMVMMLMCLPKGKSFVGKYFMPIYRPIEFCILYILFTSFDKMYFYKPLVNIFSKEFYIVCQGYLGADQTLINKLLEILNDFDENKTLFNKYPETFITQLLVVSNEIVDNYIFNFRRQIYYVDNYQFIDKSHIKLVEYYIKKKHDEWIDMTHIEYIKSIDRL